MATSTCTHCGQQTPNGGLCKQCAVLQRVDEQHDNDDTERTVECIECGGDALTGGYDPNRPGVMLCDECHPDPDNARQPQGAAL